MLEKDRLQSYTHAHQPNNHDLQKRRSKHNNEVYLKKKNSLDRHEKCVDQRQTK